MAEPFAEFGACNLEPIIEVTRTLGMSAPEQVVKNAEAFDLSPRGSDCSNPAVPAFDLSLEGEEAWWGTPPRTPSEELQVDGRRSQARRSQPEVEAQELAFAAEKTALIQHVHEELGELFRTARCDASERAALGAMDDLREELSATRREVESLRRRLEDMCQPPLVGPLFGLRPGPCIGVCDRRASDVQPNGVSRESPTGPDGVALTGAWEQLKDESSMVCAPSAPSPGERPLPATLRDLQARLARARRDARAALPGAPEKETATGSVDALVAIRNLEACQSRLATSRQEVHGLERRLHDLGDSIRSGGAMRPELCETQREACAEHSEVHMPLEAVQRKVVKSAEQAHAVGILGHGEMELMGNEALLGLQTDSEQLGLGQPISEAASWRRSGRRDGPATADSANDLVVCQ